MGQLIEKGFYSLFKVKIPFRFVYVLNAGILLWSIQIGLSHCAGLKMLEIGWEAPLIPWIYHIQHYKYTLWYTHFYCTNLCIRTLYQ